MEAERPYKLERVGPAQVVRYYADGFEQLSKQERIFAYYLSLAAISGRDIAIDQRHPHALEVRAILEQIYLHPSGIESGVMKQLSTYLKLFWINNGFYDNITSQKFIPECTFEQFVEACSLAQKNGASFDLTDESLDNKLLRLRDILFSPEYDPMLTNKTPGEDWIRSSAVNYYDRTLTYEEVRRWAETGHEQHPLNSSVRRTNGAIVEDVWRTGDAVHPAGKYAAFLELVIHYVEQALPYASSSFQETTLKKLIIFLRTGNAEDFREYNIHWVRDDARVDVNLGFIEVYLDPRSQKGEWQASVYMRNEEQTTLMQTLATQAQYFEDNAPWAAEFRKKFVTPLVANVVDALIQTGGTGPISPIGINLPNEQSLRQQYGSKSILLHNIVEASDQATGHVLVREFGFDDQEIEWEERYGTAADNLHTALHEVIGHGSAKMKTGLEGTNPSELLPGYYSTIEEARADCVALWYGWDPQLVEFGIVKDNEELTHLATTMYNQMFRGALTQLRQIGDHSLLEEDHMKNRQLIVHYVLENSGGVKMIRRDGKTYCRITDYQKSRASVGVLLAELTRIKGEGDAAAAKQLIDLYGLHVDKTLRDEVQSRASKLDVPLYLGFVQPTFEPVLDSSNKITDVTITYPPDLATQMLEYSKFTHHKSRAHAEKM